MDRFLRYALEKGKKLRVVFLLNGQMQQKTAGVASYSDKTVSLTLTGRKTLLVLPREDLLACDYARGNSGEE